jgi:hypothetical protein
MRKRNNDFAIHYQLQPHAGRLARYKDIDMYIYIYIYADRVMMIRGEVHVIILTQLQQWTLTLMIATEQCAAAFIILLITRVP